MCLEIRRIITCGSSKRPISTNSNNQKSDFDNDEVEIIEKQDKLLAKFTNSRENLPNDRNGQTFF